MTWQKMSAWITGIASLFAIIGGLYMAGDAIVWASDYERDKKTTTCLLLSIQKQGLRSERRMAYKAKEKLAVKDIIDEIRYIEKRQIKTGCE